MRIIKKTYALLSNSANAIASILLGSIALLVSIDVIGRYVFDSPFPGTFEIVESAMVVVGTIGFALALDANIHPRATILSDRLSNKANHYLIITAYFFGFLVTATMAWQLTTAARYSLSIREFVEGLVPVPLYIPKWLFVYAVGLFCLGFLIRFIDGIRHRPN